jgi:hypothetical protein
MQKAVSELSEHGIDRDLADALIAVSEGETGYAWIVDRPMTTDGAQNLCCAVVVGLERGELNKAVIASPSFRDYLVQRGFLKTASDGKLEPANGFGNPLKPWKTMVVYEHVLATQDEAALQAFSVGPTQMWMKYFNKRAGWPSTWDEAWDQYTAGSFLDGPNYSPGTRAAYYADRWLRYLTPKRYNPEGVLKEDAVIAKPGDKSSSVSWLVNHAGNPVAAEKLYEGTLFAGRKAYKTVIQTVAAVQP